MQQRLLDFDDLTRLGVRPTSRSHRWKLIREGKFPKPIKIGTRNLWPVDEIEAFIDAQKAARDAT